MAEERVSAMFAKVVEYERCNGWYGKPILNSLSAIETVIIGRE